MKKYISIILSILCILSLVGCGKKTKLESETPSQDYFNAVVLEVNDDMILAEIFWLTVTFMRFRSYFSERRYQCGI